jgi:hypothetical protein
MRVRRGTDRRNDQYQRTKVLALALVVAAAVAVLPAIALGRQTDAQSPDSSSNNIPQGPLRAPDDSHGLLGPSDQGSASPTQIASSRDAYTDESNSESRLLLQQAFSDQVDALDQQPGRLLDPSDYEKFFSDTVARVQLPGENGPQILASTVPLREENDNGVVKPVNLDVQPEGDHYVAANPVTDVSMPTVASDDLRLPGPDVGIRLNTTDGSPAPAGELDGDKLFYHDVAPDTDLTIAPMIAGAEILTQLRSVDAPERLSFHVDLPAGAELRDAGAEGLEVVGSGGSRLTLIGSPSAVDAQGSRIPTHLEQTAPDSLDLVVDHHSANALYPILVDPPFEDWYNNNWEWGTNANFNGWNIGFALHSPTFTGDWGWYSFGQSCPFGDECWGNRGLYVGAGSNWQLPNGAWTEWVYTVPQPDPSTGLTPTARINWGEFGPMNFARGGENNWGTPYAFWGMYSTDVANWTYEASGPYRDYNATGVGMTSGYQGMTPAASPRANLAVWGEGNNYDRVNGNKLTANRTADLGGMYIALDDPESPSITAPVSATGAPALSSWLSEQHAVDGPNNNQDSYKAKVLADNPSLYWRLGESSGTTAADGSTGSHSGTYTNGPGQNVHGAVNEPDPSQPGTPIDGGAVDLDGTSQFISSFYGNRRNLVANPNIETDTGSWTNWGSPQSWTRSTAHHQTGGAALKVGSSSPGFNGVLTSVPATAGKYYSAAAQLLAGNSGQMGLHLCYLNSSNQSLRCDAVSVSPGAYWGRAVIKGSSYGPSPAGTARIWLIANNETITQDFYVDSVQIEEGSSIGPYFDGSSPNARWEGAANNSVSATDGPFVNGTTRTFEGWARRDTDSTLEGLFGGSNPAQSSPYLYVGAQGFVGARNVVFGPSGNSGNTATWNDAWPGTGQWAHWALVFNESADTAELFINGESQGGKSMTSPWAASAGNFQAGRLGPDSGGYVGTDFDGQLDEVAVYDDALSADRIQTHYRAGPSGIGWVRATATDPGLGLQSTSGAPGSGFKLTYTRGDANHTQAVLYDKKLQVCDGSRTFGPQCGALHTADFPFNQDDTGGGGGRLPEGISTLTLTATDALAKTTTKTFDAKVDRSGPDIDTPTGGLYSQSQPGYDLTVHATDGTAHSLNDRTVARSGVRRIDLYADGGSSPIATTNSQPCSAAWGSCDLTLHYTLDPQNYSESDHTFYVVATDELGHATRYPSPTDTWTQAIDRSPPKVTSVSGVITSGWLTNPSQNADLQISSKNAFSGVSKVTVTIPQASGPPVTLQHSYDCSQGCPEHPQPASWGGVSIASLPEGLSTVTATAYDAAGNPGPTSSTQVRVDRSPATITDVQGPAPNEWLKSGTRSITVAAQNPFAGVDHLTLDLPGGSRLSHQFDCSAGCPEQASYQFSFDTAQLPNGVANTIATAYGPGGVPGNQPSSSLQIDHSNPVLTVNGRLFDTPSALVAANEPTTVDVHDEGSGVESVSVAVDGSEIDTRPLSDFDPDAQICTGASCSFRANDSVDLSGVSGGQHTVTMTVTDLAGNSGTVTNTVRVDPNQPELNVAGDLADLDGQPLPGDSAAASITANDQTTGDSGLKRIAIEVNGNEVQDYPGACTPNCPGTLQTGYEYLKSSWPQGPNEINITATDLAGNSTRRTFSVDYPPSLPDHPACPTADPTTDPVSDPITPSEAVADLNQQSDTPLAPTDPATDPDSGDQIAPTLVVPDPDTIDDPNISVSNVTVAEATSSTPAGGFTIGEAACLTPDATTNAATDAHLVGGDQPIAAVYANTAPQTDTVYRPTPNGSAIILNMRGSDAPDTYRWNVSLNPGETVEALSSGGYAIVDTTQPDPPTCQVPAAPDGGTQISSLPDAGVQKAQSAHDLCQAENEVDDGTVRGVIAPPLAEDEAGHAIPVTLEFVENPDVPPYFAVQLGLHLPGKVKLQNSTPDMGFKSMCKKIFAGDPSGFRYWCLGERGNLGPDDGPLDPISVSALVDEDPTLAADLQPALNYLEGSPANVTKSQSRWCDDHKFLCKDYLFTGKAVDQVEPEEWNTRDASGISSDNTRANAWRHMLWVAYMIQKHPDNRRDAFTFAILHEESSPVSTHRPERLSSRMDVVNDITGRDFAKKDVAESEDPHYFCVISTLWAHDAVNVGHDKDPYRWDKNHAGHDAVFRFSRDAGGLEIHRQSNAPC